MHLRTTLSLQKRQLVYLKNACKNIIFPAKFKIKFFYFLKPILLPPYLSPYIYRWFHAKFQDSRTNNKKRPPPSDPKRPLAVYTTVCIIIIFIWSRINVALKITWFLHHFLHLFTFCSWESQQHNWKQSKLLFCWHVRLTPWHIESSLNPVLMHFP